MICDRSVFRLLRGIGHHKSNVGLDSKVKTLKSSSSSKSVPYNLKVPFPASYLAHLHGMAEIVGPVCSVDMYPFNPRTGGSQSPPPQLFSEVAGETLIADTRYLVTFERLQRRVGWWQSFEYQLIFFSEVFKAIFYDRHIRAVKPVCLRWRVSGDVILPFKRCDMSISPPMKVKVKVKVTV